MKRLGMERKEAEEWINKTNIYRWIYYRYHTGQKWRDAENYDLILNTSRFSYDECVEIIKMYINLFRKDSKMGKLIKINTAIYLVDFYYKNN